LKTTVESPESGEYDAAGWVGENKEMNGPTTKDESNVAFEKSETGE
jgi:hypothetical protein